MRESTSFHILHLTDAHIGHPNQPDQQIVLASLVDDLKSTFSATPPDVIIFSGDIIWGEDHNAEQLTKQFDTARKWLESIQNVWPSLGVKPSILIVPGNHDVVRSEIDTAHTAWLKTCSQQDVENMIQSRNKSWKSIQARLSQWWTFNKSVHDGKWIHDDNLMMSYGQFVFCGKTISIVGYNSSWASHSSRTDQNQLRMSKFQVHTGLAIVRDADLAIAVHHHPIGSWMHSDEGIDLERKIQSKFKIALHGHVHSGWYTHHSDGHLSLSGGACWAGSSSENGYTWLTLDANLESVELTSRQFFDKGEMSWGPASAPSKFDANGKKRLLLNPIDPPTSVEEKPNIAPEPQSLPVASVTEIAATFPLEIDSHPWLQRRDTLRTLSDLVEAKGTVLLTGPAGSGKTTLAALFARQFPNSCISIFFDNCRSWEAQLSRIYKDIYNQCHWLLNATESNIEEQQSPGKLQRVSDLLSRKMRHAKKPSYIIIDGLNSFPTGSSSSQIEDVFKMLDLFGSTFKKIVTIEPEQLPARFENFSHNTFPTPYFNDAEASQFLNGVATPELIDEIIKITRRKPAALASIRRILKLWPGLQPSDFTDKIDDLLKLEWKQVPETHEPTLLILACVANFPSRFTAKDLSELLQLSEHEVESIVATLPLLIKKPTTNEICFESQTMGQFAHLKLKRFERSIRERLLDVLMKRQDSYESLDEIPLLLNDLGRNEDLLAFVSPDHLTALLQKGQSYNLALAKVEIAFAAAHRLDRPTDYYRLALHKSCLFQFMNSEGAVLMAEAMMVMGMGQEAMQFAKSQVAIENRLMTMAVIAKHSKTQGVVPPTGLSEEINRLVANLPKESTASQRLELATELIHAYPELAIRIIESAPGTTEDINSALLKVTFHALAGSLRNDTVFDESSKPIASILQNDKIRRFTNAAQTLFGQYSAKEALLKIKSLTEPTDQIYFLRQWASSNSASEDGYPIVEYSLDLIVKTTEFVPNARVLHQLASPLPHLYRDYSVVVLATRFTNQAALLKGKGFSQDYVALELILIRTSFKYEEGDFSSRLESLIQFTSDLSDNPTKFHCLSLISSCLATYLTPASDLTFQSLGELVEMLLDSTFGDLIHFTANNYKACARGLQVVHSYNPAKAIGLALRLNTETRRNQMLADFIHAEFEKTCPDPSVLEFIAGRITDSNHADYAICYAVQDYQHGKSGVPAFELLEWILTRARGMTTQSLKFYTLSSLLALVPSSAESILDTLRNTAAEELRRVWISIDDPSIRWSTGLQLIKTVGQGHKLIAAEFWRKLQLMQSDKRMPNEGCAFALQDNIRLALRLFKGLLKRDLATEVDRRTLIGHVESLPSPQTRALLFGDLTIAYFRQKKLAEGRDIAQTYLWPNLSVLAQTARASYETTFIQVAPALFLANAENAKESMRTFSPLNRDLALLKICEFLKRKTFPDDPFASKSRDALQIPGMDLFDIVSLLELAEDDSFICWTAVQVIKTASKDQRLSREQKSDLHSRLLRLATSKLPSPRFITHNGYQLVVRAELSAFYGVPKMEEIQAIIDEAHQIDNIADRAFVLASIATNLPSKLKDKACALLYEAIDLIPSIFAIEDQLERCESICDFASEVSRAVAKDALDKAVSIVKGPHTNTSAQQIDRLIDSANLIDPSIAEQLSKDLDTDPARSPAPKAKARKELKKSLRKMLTDGNFPDSLDVRKHDAFLEVVREYWGECNAAKQPWLKLPTCRNLIKVAATMPLERCTPLWMFIVENLVTFYEDTPSAATFIHPLFDAVCTNTDFMVLLGKTTMMNRLRDLEQSMSEFHSGQIIIPSGERLRAIDEIERWVLENADDIIYVIDPSFNVDSLSLLQAIRRSSSNSCIVAICTKDAQKSSPKGLSFEEQYREESRIYPELLSTGGIEIKILGSPTYGEVDFGERAIVSRSGALLLTSPFLDYGTQEVSEMRRVGSTEAENIMSVVDDYLNSRKRLNLKRNISISTFTL